MRAYAFAAAVVGILTSNAAVGADICQGIFIMDTGAVEAPDSIMRAGERQYAITQFRVESGKMKSYCSHGGYCYPSNTIQLTNCKVNTSRKSVDGDVTYYELDVIRSKVSSSRLRRDDIENRLLEMGLCSACASSAARLYISRPKSKCGRLIQSALEGNPVARTRITDGGLCN